jgi:multiple antibiotic resistance protein
LVPFDLGRDHPRRKPPAHRALVLVAALSSLLGVILMCITVYFCYRYAQRLSRILGGTGTAVVVRLSAFILLCIGVQIMWNGIDALTGITGPPRAPQP